MSFRPAIGRVVPGYPAGRDETIELKIEYSQETINRSESSGRLGNPRFMRISARRLRPPGLPRADASRDVSQRDQMQAVAQGPAHSLRVTQGPRSHLQPRPPLTQKDIQPQRRTV
jgi:hypothetical protein